ncbi:hypothetical protein LJC46_01875, partial [Desulfovibrio sp. OttesenSCG-928-G15]|nr:hypothetical protein [Desulfovibrio sp. OttesenSCG-928-G15]
MMSLQRTLSLVFVLISCLPLVACREEAIAPGVVATVNGEPVFFREMEARRVNYFSGFASDTQGVEDALLQEQYRYVLGRIIAEEIVWQYMDGKGVTLAKEELLEEEQKILSDYPEGAFENMIMEEAVTLGFWRKGIARRLMVDKFIMQILRPEISITADEVQQYYRAHKEEFVIPEQWHFIQILGKDLKEVEQASKHLAEGKNATATQKEFLVTIHDICLSVDMLPQ